MSSWIMLKMQAHCLKWKNCENAWDKTLRCVWSISNSRVKWSGFCTTHSASLPLGHAQPKQRLCCPVLVRVRSNRKLRSFKQTSCWKPNSRMKNCGRSVLVLHNHIRTARNLLFTFWQCLDQSIFVSQGCPRWISLRIRSATGWKTCTSIIACTLCSSAHTPDFSKLAKEKACHPTH